MCIFCQIVDGSIPAYKVYEDDDFLAFLDISQATLGHTLVIPKKHIPSVFALDKDTASKLFSLTTALTSKVCRALNTNDVNVLTNNGLLAGQTINHVHLHILPRFVGDTLQIAFHKQNLSPDEFLKLQQKILDS